MEIIKTCPLNHKCEYIKKEKIYRCVGYVKLIGKDPQSNKEYDEYACSLFEWNPILQIENSQEVSQATASIQSFRNNLIKSLQTMINKKEGYNELV